MDGPSGIVETKVEAEAEVEMVSVFRTFLTFRLLEFEIKVEAEMVSFFRTFLTFGLLEVKVES